MVIFVEKPDKTLLDWYENEGINYVNAKININIVSLSFDCNLSDSFKPIYLFTIFQLYAL